MTANTAPGGSRTANIRLATVPNGGWSTARPPAVTF